MLPLVRKAPELPSISGGWVERENIPLTIVQNGAEFTADCSYEYAGYGTVRWRMTGTISGDGSIRGELVHTKAPATWARTQVRTGVLSTDGDTINGRAVFEDGINDFVWRRRADAKEFVGRWRIEATEGVFFMTLGSSFDAKKTNDPNSIGKWEIVGKEARVTWSEGWRNILRPQKDISIAFKPGTSWDDPPTSTVPAFKEPQK